MEEEMVMVMVMVMMEAEQKFDFSKLEGQKAVVEDVQEDENIVP